MVGHYLRDHIFELPRRLEVTGRLRHLRGLNTSRLEWRYPWKVLTRAAQTEEREYYPVSCLEVWKSEGL